MNVLIAAVICDNGTPTACGLLAVDRDQQLRIVRRKRRVQVRQARTRRTRRADHGVGDAIDVAKRIASAILQDELEAANCADAGNRGRLRGKRNAARDREKLRRNPADDIVRRMALAQLGAVVDRLQRRKDQPRVRARSARQREAHDRERAEHILILADLGSNPVGELGRVAQAKRPAASG